MLNIIQSKHKVCNYLLLIKLEWYLVLCVCVYVFLFFFSEKDKAFFSFIYDIVPERI